MQVSSSPTSDKFQAVEMRNLPSNSNGKSEPSNQSPNQPTIANLNSEIANSTNSVNPILGQPTEYRLSKRRWLMLLAMSVFGFSVAVTGDTSPILHVILKLLDIKVDTYIYIGQIFTYLMAATLVPTAWLVDKYGTRFALYLGAILFSIEGAFRALLYFPHLKSWAQLKMVYYFISGFLGVEMITIYFLLPLKVSETWFSESERSVAWSIMYSQIKLGISVASATFPRVMQDVHDITILGYINIVLVSITLITVLLCVTRSEPEFPPSKRVDKAGQDAIPFLAAIRKTVTDKEMMLHLVYVAVSESVFFIYSGVLQDILSSRGHDAIFAGNIMSIDALVSLVLQVIFALFTHRVKNATLVCKLAALVQTLFTVLYLLILTQTTPGWIIFATSVALVISKSYASPNYTNMQAHLASGLVSQATITGVQMLIVLIAMTIVQLRFASFIVIGDSVNSYGKALLFLIIVTIVNALLYLGFFKGKPSKEPDETNTVQGSSDTSRPVGPD